MVPVSELTDEMITELNALFNDNKGMTIVHFDIVDDVQNVSIDLYSKSHPIEVTQKLLNALGDMQNIYYRIN
jgi:hypothetical protein